MERRSQAYLHDVRTAAELVTRFVRGKSFAQYDADPLLRSAVERQLEIIGEALAQLARTDPTTASKVPELRRIIALRNILVHGYRKVDHRVIWSIVDRDLPALRREVDVLLAHGSGSTP